MALALLSVSLSHYDHTGIFILRTWILGIHEYYRVVLMKLYLLFIKSVKFDTYVATNAFLKAPTL